VEEAMVNLVTTQQPAEVLQFKQYLLEQIGNRLCVESYKPQQLKQTELFGVGVLTSMVD
jgi:hypothetical protein